jgi:hypothetical protein
VGRVWRESIGRTYTKHSIWFSSIEQIARDSHAYFSAFDEITGFINVPPYEILVTQRAADYWDSARFLDLVLNFGSFSVSNPFFSVAADAGCEVTRHVLHV